MEQELRNIILSTTPSGYMGPTYSIKHEELDGIVGVQMEGDLATIETIPPVKHGKLNLNDDAEVETCASSYSRKRQRNFENWKNIKAKVARNKGQMYTTCRTNQQVPARAVGKACKCGCFDKLGIVNIKEIFDYFWEIGDYDLQNAYISNLVTSVKIKRSRVKDRPSRQTRRLSYTLIHNNTVYSVCRIAFYNIHSISDRRVRTALEKQCAPGIIELDKRGRKITSKISQVRRQSAIDHIDSFPKVSTQDSEAKSPHMEYLPSDLNVNTMYALYLDWLNANGSEIQPVSNHYYRDVFNSEFNLGFEKLNNMGHPVNG
ncbi:unnamed protein product [Meganyctiphanes norvegica]|uniref:Uncharacterized protein n=2 Tax=Meganyctiphanes norvegica TaxID=48144 RepID=A0AAV2QSJ5_MEGNR